MRTTIVIQDDLTKKIKTHIQQKKLSQFIDLCIREHYEAADKKKKREALAAAYQQASQEEDAGNDFDLIDIEEWPE